MLAHLHIIQGCHFELLPTHQVFLESVLLLQSLVNHARTRTCLLGRKCIGTAEALWQLHRPKNLPAEIYWKGGRAGRESERVPPLSLPVAWHTNRQI